MGNDDVPQLLGRIDGKLDQVIEMAKEHRDDDVRRFSDVYKKLGEHESDINQAKGAKAAIAWLIGGGLVSIGASIVALAKAFGG